MNTSDGIILFDTLNNTEEAQRIIEGGMKTMGLDPTRIKYIVIMHGHADHFGGAKYLQDKSHPRVLMGLPIGTWSPGHRARTAAGRRFCRRLATWT